MPRRERRHLQRLEFEEPLVAQFGAMDAEIIDLSLEGARILHTQPLANGRTGRLRFRWLDHTVAVEAEVVRCKIERSSGGGTLFSSGLRYHSEGQMPVDIRDVIAEQVLRALEEQIANARGSFIPLTERMTIFRSADRLTVRPPGGQDHRVPKAAQAYLSCTLLDSGWKKAVASTPVQPYAGFTVSAYEDPQHVDLLCRTYENADEPTRKMIRMLAEISLA
ncbi:MAG: PilZ domain-containing protein [Thermoanaerobaculia bacterium]